MGFRGVWLLIAPSLFQGLRRRHEWGAFSLVPRQEKFDAFAVAGKRFLAIELVDGSVESLMGFVEGRRHSRVIVQVSQCGICVSLTLGENGLGKSPDSCFGG